MSGGKGGAAAAREAAAGDLQSQEQQQQAQAQEASGQRTSGRDTGDERAEAGASESRDDYRPPTVDAVAGEAEREVARRAYELYLARGGEHGFDMEDWIQAENELRGRATGASNG